MNAEALQFQEIQKDVKSSLDKSFWAGFNAGIKIAAQIAQKSEYARWYNVASFDECEFRPVITTLILGALHE